MVYTVERKVCPVAVIDEFYTFEFYTFVEIYVKNLPQN